MKRRERKEIEGKESYAEEEKGAKKEKEGK